jgi:hypothetical protein
MRFYFDPNTITMASGNQHYLVLAYNSAGTATMFVELRNSSGSYQIRAAQLLDSGSWRNTSWFTISDAPHYIEVDWRAATAVGANNGLIALWIDGVARANLTGSDADTRRIDTVRLGAVSGIDTGTRGTYYFDAFESRRSGAIGAASTQVTVSEYNPSRIDTLPVSFGESETLELEVPDENQEESNAPADTVQIDIFLPFVGR